MYFLYLMQGSFRIIPIVTPHHHIK